MNRDRCAALVARFASVLTFRILSSAILSVILAGCCAPAAFGQYGRSKQGYVKSVPYTYNGQQFTIVTYGGQPAQVTLNGQIILLISNGNVVTMPGIDAHVVANAQDALKAFQAGTPSGNSGAPAAAGGVHSRV